MLKEVCREYLKRKYLSQDEPEEQNPTEAA